MNHQDHSGEHAAYCWGITTGAWRKSMAATSCPYCKAWDAGYEAGFRNGSGRDNWTITTTGGAA